METCFCFMAVAVIVLWSGGVVHAQLYLNGKPAFADSTSNILLFSISQEYFGNDFTATVQVDTTCQWHNITVNGKSLTNNPITFNDVSGDKAFIVRAIEGRKQIVKRLMFTFLPIMSINGDVGYDYVDAKVTLLSPDGTLDETMTARVKWRGGYTNGENRHKRNYSIKFVDENGEKQNRKLLGMRRDNHWKLDAGQVDLSRVRNRVATDLWLDMSRQPYYYEQAPDALMAARGEMIEVVVNGRYMGIYNLMENIDRKQLQVRKFDDDTKEIHGMVWNATQWTDVTAFKKTAAYSNSNPYYNSFFVEYPDFEDVNPTNHQDLANAVRFVAYSSINTFNAQAHNYFDMPVIIDYAIFNQLLTAIDNEVNNIYWVIYDRTVDKKLTLAVWDLDWSLGTNRNSPDFRGGRAAPDYDYEFSSKLLYNLQNPNCVYYKAMVERYWQLRSSWLSVKSLSERVGNAIDRLVACGAAAREEARWSGDSDINGLELNLTSEKEFIIDWIKRRLVFLDRTLMRHPCDVNGDGAVTSSDITAVQAYLMEGQLFGDKLDINGDGYVTSADLSLLYEYILGY